MLLLPPGSSGCVLCFARRLSHDGRLALLPRFDLPLACTLVILIRKLVKIAGDPCSRGALTNRPDRRGRIGCYLARCCRSGFDRCPELTQSADALQRVRDLDNLLELFRMTRQLVSQLRPVWVPLDRRFNPRRHNDVRYVLECIFEVCGFLPQRAHPLVPALIDLLLRFLLRLLALHLHPGGELLLNLLACLVADHRPVVRLVVVRVILGSRWTGGGLLLLLGWCVTLAL